MDSERIVNLMNADKFFNQKLTKNYVKKVAKERYTLQPEKAQNIVRKANKVSISTIVFTDRQLEIAVQALKGK